MAFACCIDERICKFIAGGNEEAMNIICTYHMDEIRRIRNNMLGILRDKYFYDVDKLHQSFMEAVMELELDVNDLLKPSVTLVSVDPNLVKIAGL